MKVAISAQVFLPGIAMWDADQVDMVIHGSGERPQLSELGDQLDASLNRPFEMKLVVLPSEREEYVDEGE